MIRARLENFLYVPLPDCPQLAYTLAELAARRNGVSAETLKARLTLPLRDEKGVVVGSFGAYDDTREGWLGIPWFCPEADAARDRYGVDDFTERGEKLDVGLSTPFVFRDGQEELVHAALAELVGGEHPPRSVIACAPPGMGKTVVAVALAHRLGRAFCVIVNTTEIMRRWEEEILKRFGVLPTIIGGGHGLLEEGRCPAIGVAMVQTLTTKASKLPTAYWVEYFRRYGTMIADEADCLPTQVFSQSIPMFHARYRIAVTATLQRRDGLTKLIHWHFGKAVEAADKREPPRAVQIRLPETVRDPAFTFRGDLNRNFGISLLAKHRQRNEWVLALIKKIYLKGRRVMVLGERIEQLTWLEAQLVCDQHQVLRLYGDQRDDLTTDPGRCVLLSTYALGGRGVDIPWIDTVLLATPRANVTQAMGRVMRELPGKKPAWVIDLVDQSSMLFARLAEKRQREYASRRVQVYGSGLDDFVAKL